MSVEFSKTASLSEGFPQVDRPRHIRSNCRPTEVSRSIGTAERASTLHRPGRASNLRRTPRNYRGSIVGAHAVEFSKDRGASSEMASLQEETDSAHDALGAICGPTGKYSARTSTGACTLHALKAARSATLRRAIIVDRRTERRPAASRRRTAAPYLACPAPRRRRKRRLPTRRT